MSLLFALFSLVSGYTTEAGIAHAAELGDLRLAVTPLSMGYLDAALVQSLSPTSTLDRSWGQLDGFRQRGRFTAMMVGPQEQVNTHMGLVFGFETGGWTNDLHFLRAQGSSERWRAWTWGVAGTHRDQDLAWAAGAHHSGSAILSSPLETAVLDKPEFDAWGIVRWGHMGATVAGAHALRWARAGWLPPSCPWKGGVLEQLRVEAEWRTAAWNPYESSSAFALEAEAPLYQDRLRAVAAAGTEGFRFGRIEADLGTEGLVGLDMTYWHDRQEGFHPGIRMRIPLITFGWNDPDDRAQFGAAKFAPVWSARFQMAWDGPAKFYRPGRRSIKL